ncbi:MAG: hypothetical protein JW888_17935, partial [Pirellulales bacterium]|nr:hypothetical protein [Pirellulales bacterium]
VAVVALACLLAIGVAVGWTIWLRPPRGEGNLAGETHQPNAVDAAGPRVAVNFVTEPLFEATIWLDDKQLIRPDGTPYTTPCTVPDVPAGPAKIVFRHAEAPERDGGLVDFRAVREVKVHWEAEP